MPRPTGPAPGRASCSRRCAPSPGGRSARSSSSIRSTPWRSAGAPRSPAASSCAAARCCSRSGRSPTGRSAAPMPLAALRREVEQVTQCVLVVDDHRVRIVKADGRPPGVEGSVLSASAPGRRDPARRRRRRRRGSAAALRSLRACARNLSQTDLARLAGVSASAISHAERGQSRPLARHAARSLGAAQRHARRAAARRRRARLPAGAPPRSERAQQLEPRCRCSTMLGVGLRVFLARLPPRAAGRARRAPQGRRGGDRRSRPRADRAGRSPRALRAGEALVAEAQLDHGLAQRRRERGDAVLDPARPAPRRVGVTRTTAQARSRTRYERCSCRLGAPEPGPTFRYVLDSLRSRRAVRPATSRSSSPAPWRARSARPGQRPHAAWSATTALCDEHSRSAVRERNARAELARGGVARDGRCRRGRTARCAAVCSATGSPRRSTAAAPTTCAARPGGCASACSPATAVGDDLVRALAR